MCPVRYWEHDKHLSVMKFKYHVFATTTTYISKKDLPFKYNIPLPFKYNIPHKIYFRNPETPLLVLYNCATSNNHEMSYHSKLD